MVVLPSHLVPPGWGVLRFALFLWVLSGLVLAGRLLFSRYEGIRPFNFVWAFTGIGLIGASLALPYRDFPTGILVFGAIVSACIAWADERLTPSEDAA